MEIAATLGDGGVTSIAPASDSVAYLARTDGISRVDLGSGVTTRVKAGEGVDLGGLTRIRWYKGALVGLQQTGGACRAVRIPFDRAGLRATQAETIDPSVGCAAPTAATIVGDVLYYLTAASGLEMSVRTVRLTRLTP
jgi:hypothetical protein